MSAACDATIGANGSKHEAITLEHSDGCRVTNVNVGEALMTSGRTCCIDQSTHQCRSNSLSAGFLDHGNFEKEPIGAASSCYSEASWSLGKSSQQKNHFVGAVCGQFHIYRSGRRNNPI